MANVEASFPYKVALVTGGSSGIGLALARRLAAQGVRVWLLARRRKVLEAALASLEGAAGKCGMVVADVADWRQVQAAAIRVESEAGLPDLVINSAGVTHPGYVQDIPLDVFRQMMEINYLGTVHTVKALLPGMIARGSGHIVNIASAAAFLGIFGYTAYGASKYAVRGFSDTLRAEVKPLGLRVSIAFPPDTDTPQLAYENRFKPPETRALAGKAGVLSADRVADEILRGVRRGRYVILPGLQNKVLYRLSSLLGNAIFPLMDWMVTNARRHVSVR